MMRSLESYGQLSPIVVFLHEGRWELLDGFKRLGAARKLQSMERLVARRIEADERDRKSTRLNSSHGYISYAVFCLKKKKKNKQSRICSTESRAHENTTVDDGDWPRCW